MDTKALRQKILDLAIRGKLVPQDPNDEPASVLLERIRAEKQQMVKDGKLKPKDIKNDTVIFKGDDNLHYEKYGEPLPDGWAVTNFGTLLSYEQPTKYIVNNTNYKPTYETPVLTAGKSFILGYTDETDNIFDDLPVIIFDDFTTESKYVDFAFKVKSSAMKILHINQELVLPKYAFFLMQATEIDHDNHQRYWISTYSQEIISLPPLSEQIKIIEAIDYLFELVQSVDNNIHNLKSAIKSVKSKILDLAISGKLVPQDPNDEPASVLLERIRAEKEELIKQGKIKRDKKESVIFKGDDNSYYQDLPEMWELVNFKDCATLISGRDLNKNEYNAESIGIPYITGASNFINRNILINRWTTIPKTISEVNDILITCKGTVGELAINKYGNIHIARQIMAIRIYKNINLEYIKFFLESIVMEIKKTANGLIPGISRDDILSLNIPLPPLAEQKRIVDEIEKIFAVLDDIANQVA